MFSNRIAPVSYPRPLSPDNGPNPMPLAAAPERPLFWLAVTPQRIEQLVLMMVLVGHSSYRAVQEILTSALHCPLSLGSIHNLVQQAARRAAQINRSQDRRLLPAIAVGAHDEIFQGQRPALVGVDLQSSYCYLLAGVSHRDADSWSIHLLLLQEAGLSLSYSVADGGHALRLAQQQCLPGVPCHGDVFHALQALSRVCASLDRRALGSMQAVEELEARFQRCWKKTEAAALGRALAAARRNQRQLVEAADDLRILSQWMRQDVLGLKGPDPAVRRELFDWIVQEIAQRAAMGGRLLKAAAKALAAGRDRLLAFARELERQLKRAAEAVGLPLYLIKRVYELEKGDEGDATYWQERAELAHQLGGRLEEARRAVVAALAATHRASSLVENLNSRIRPYFFLRRQVGREDFLELLRFYFNHHVLVRSRSGRRRGQSPAAALAGEGHPHWLEMLSYGSPRLN
jgi:hypothetical protein